MRSTPKGDAVRMRAGGRPGDVHVAGRNMDIHHGLNGNRSVSVERADPKPALLVHADTDSLSPLYVQTALESSSL